MTDSYSTESTAHSVHLSHVPTLHHCELVLHPQKTVLVLPHGCITAMHADRVGNFMQCLTSPQDRRLCNTAARLCIIGGGEAVNSS